MLCWREGGWRRNRRAGVVDLKLREMGMRCNAN
jgi:hypothetical protein